MKLNQIRTPKKGVSWFLAILILIVCVDGNLIVSAEEVLPEELSRRYEQEVQPFVQSYCVNCHNSTKPEGRLDLSIVLSTVHVAENLRVWEAVAERLAAEEMPPKTATNQPSIKQRGSITTWVSSLLEHEAICHAGDPGVVLARRLSNAEFDYTIRDLTGVDIRPAREFPVDPANESGFDNSGESLMMSPSLSAKYLASANLVADHLVLTPHGFVFSDRILASEKERDEFCIQKIIDFYVRHQVDYADYFFAVWEYQNRELLGEPNATLEDIAAKPRLKLSATKSLKFMPSLYEDANAINSALPKSPLSKKYLKAIQTALLTPENHGPIAQLQEKWNRLNGRFADAATKFSNTTETLDYQKANHGDDQTDVVVPQWKFELREECEQLREFVIRERDSLNTYLEPLQIRSVPIRSVPLLSTDCQPLVSWHNHQIMRRRMQYTGGSKGPQLDAALARFCRLFPDIFAVTARQLYLKEPLTSPKNPLSAGFQYQHGFFRDDEPLCELVLDELEKAELDDLWKTLQFVTRSPFRQYLDFLWHDRGEPPSFIDGPQFDFARPSNTNVTTQQNMDRLRDLYIAKMLKFQTTNPKTLEKSIDAVKTYFSDISAAMRWIERTQIEAEPSHLKSLLEFAERAYRRPLRAEENSRILGFYRKLREQEGRSHAEAMHDSVVTVLMSPNFCFRSNSAERGDDSIPLDEYELASRLSYFLWASLPDKELLSSAAHRNLHERTVLLKHVRRMLCDSRVRGFATEFTGHWLDFRRFEEHNAVDRERFPAFTDELRRAMFEEPIRLFVHILSTNRSILEFLDADYTFVNPTLATHYEIDPKIIQSQSSESHNGWTRVNHVNQIGRGGLLTMSVFLTQSSPGLRTSPVKRGHWVVNRLLGERIPAPPPNVPELPKDEASTGEVTLPQLLARHRNDSACAVCHQRFDSIGVVFEGYGPVGERRDKDQGGHPVETHAILPNGSEAMGIPGLKEYLHLRRNEFVTNFCRKIFSYALGRSLLPSDRPTLNQMQDQLVANQYRFDSLVELVVTSPQFLKKHAANAPEKNKN